MEAGYFDKEIKQIKIMDGIVRIFSLVLFVLVVVVTVTASIQGATVVWLPASLAWMMMLGLAWDSEELNVVN